MTNSAVELRPATHAPGRIGQGTAVEQTRAVAEVEAAIVVAQRVPRDIERAVRDMYRSCRQKSLAEKAFFRFPRAGQTVSGPSVQLARELARCFGNVQYGITELRRDDAYGQSEMQAWCWDVQTNTRSSTTFIVPHARDKRGGPERLTDMRDIYENNANMGARRLREMVFAILPGWYTEDAITACYETLAGDGDGQEFAGRVTACVEAFGKLGVTGPQLENKLGGPQATWTPYDLAQLQVIYRSLMRGEIRREDEFPAAHQRVTAEEITGNGHQTSAPATEGTAAAGTETKPRPRRQRQPHFDQGEQGINPPPIPPAHAIDVHWQRLGVEDRDERLALTARLAGVDALGSTSDLDDATQRAVLARLVHAKHVGEVHELIEHGDAPESGES